MTLYTALTIKHNEVELLPLTEDDKYGFYIGMFEDSPSGNTRPRPLVSSKCVFETPEKALEAGQALIDEIKAADLKLP